MGQVVSRQELEAAAAAAGAAGAVLVVDVGNVCLGPIENAVALADRALSAAKRAGKARVVTAATFSETSLGSAAR